MKLIVSSLFSAVILMGCSTEKTSDVEIAIKQDVETGRLSDENKAIFDAMLPAFHVTKVAVSCLEAHPDDNEFEEVFIAYDGRNKAVAGALMTEAKESGAFTDEIRANFASEAQLKADKSITSEPTSEACWRFANQVKSAEFDLAGISLDETAASQ